MFGQKEHNLEEVKKGGGNKYLNYGNQMASITSLCEIKKSKDGKAFQVKVNMEGPTITEDGFEADDSAKRGGRVGRVFLTNGYINPEKNPGQFDEFETKIQLIAKKCGDATLEAVKAVKVPTIEEYMDKVIPLISKTDLYFHICASEYQAEDKENNIKAKYTLHLGRYGFVASSAEGINHLHKFDVNDENCYVVPKQANDAPVTNSGTAAPTKKGW